jgi:peroxiredoxin
MSDSSQTIDTRPGQPQRRRLPWWLLLLVELGLLLAIFFGVQLWLQGQAMGKAPGFVAQDLQGEEVSLEQSLAEGPVMLHFWAVWCPNCKQEQDMIDRLAADGQVLTVATQSGGATDVAAYVDAESLSMPVLIDPDGVLLSRYGVQGVPAKFIIDRDGEIRFRVMGLSSEWGLRLRLWAAGWL